MPNAQPPLVNDSFALPCLQVKARWVITSDHGNADDMVQRDKKGKPMTQDGRLLMLTSHTLAPVPVFFGGHGIPDNTVFREDLPEGGLANVAATVMNLMGYEAPDRYQPSLVTVKE